MKQRENCRISESGVSELIGALILISMIVLVVAVIAAGMISRPSTEKIPQLRFSAVNNASIPGQYSVDITHDGGDEIPEGEYAVFINGNSAPVSPGKITPDPETTIWSIGKTLNVNTSGSEPRKVSVYYYGKSVSNPTLLGERTFGTIPVTTGTATTATTATTVPTTTQTPCQPPVAAFTASPTSGSAPLMVQFNDITTGTPTTWNWNFGDGTPMGLQQNLTHIYTVPGTYNVSLTATNGCGSNTITKTRYINALGPSLTVWAWVKWVNKPSIPVPTNQMWATLVLDGSSDNNRRYHIQHDQNNTKFEFAIGTANMSGSGKWVQSTTNPVNGSWYLVTGVYNQTSGKMAIYINGNQEGSWVTADSSGLRGNPGTPHIGGIQTGYPNGKGICFASFTNCADNTRTRLLNGYVTGVQYFDYVKSPNEILAYYNAGGHPA